MDKCTLEMYQAPGVCRVRAGGRVGQLQPEGFIGTMLDSISTNPERERGEDTHTRLPGPFIMDAMGLVLLGAYYNSVSHIFSPRWVPWVPHAKHAHRADDRPRDGPSARRRSSSCGGDGWWRARRGAAWIRILESLIVQLFTGVGEYYVRSLEVEEMEMWSGETTAVTLLRRAELAVRAEVMCTVPSTVLSTK